MGKKVTICICVKNRQNAIQKTLDTVLKQDFDDYNILVCDGHSGDMTMNRVFDYQQNTNNKVVAWQTEKEGYVNSHNFILSKVDSEYICFIDSDDIIESNKLSEQVKYLDSHPEVDIVSTSTILPEKKILVNSFAELNDEQIFNFVKAGNSILSICHPQSCMFRKSCLEKFNNGIYFYPEYEEGLCGQGFLYTLHFLGYKFANITSTIYFYTRGVLKDSMSNNLTPNFANAIDTLSYEKKKEYIEELFNVYNPQTKKRGRPKKEVVE